MPSLILEDCESDNITDPVTIRRLFLEDSEWERTSNSWKELKPIRDFNIFRVSDETPQECCNRLWGRFEIPLEVIDQWLFKLYYKRESTNNYGWLDFDRIGFEFTKLSVRQLMGTKVIQEYSQWVENTEKRTPFSDFTCSQKDKAHWLENGTWRVPPVILDVSTLANLSIPEYADIRGPLQLVEGHTRMGYLRAVYRAGMAIESDLHSVYRMYLRG